MPVIEGRGGSGWHVPAHKTYIREVCKMGVTLKK
jgi:hypothetical protein